MQTIKNILALVLIALWLIACTRKEAAPPAPPPAPISAPAPAPKPAPVGAVPETRNETAPYAKVIALEPPVVSPGQHSTKTTMSMKHAAPPHPVAGSKQSTTSLPTADQVNSYVVKVEANKTIKMSIDAGTPTSGQMTVWIGQPQFEPKNQEGMIAGSGVIQTNSIAMSARVTPNFPDDPSAFKAEPDTSKCMVVEPTGSIAHFKITPMRTGQFRVGADVDLYTNTECAGPVAAKTADPITVVVSAYAPTSGLLEITWSAFKNFYKEILAAVFGLLILLFRKQLAKLLGIKSES